MSSPSPSSLIPVLPYQCMNNFNQEVARTIVRKVSATLSIISSFYVLRLIYIKYRSTTPASTASNNNNNNSRNNTVDSYHRIMAGLCIYDILFSFFWWFMGSWMTPRDTGWWGARYGNTVSCMIQGAVTDFALIGIWVSRLVDPSFFNNPIVIVFFISHTCQTNTQHTHTYT
jgi:hypothetical protein